MPELDLREVLSDLADEVTTVDLIDRMSASSRANHRRGMTIAAVATAAAVVAVVLGVGVLADQTSPARPYPRTSPSPITPAGPLATTSVSPSYLPAGVTFGGRQPRKFPTPSGFRRSAASGAWYRLPGAANRSTEPPDLEGSLTAHPSTSLQVSFVPDVMNLPPNIGVPNPLSTKLFSARFASVAGNRAVITVDRKVATNVRIDWIDADGYHAVMCDGLTTAQGLSGLPVPTMLRIARSLYTPSDSTPAPTSTAVPAGAVRYPSVGVTLAPAGQSAAALSRDAAVAVYAHSAFNQHRAFTARLAEYSHGWPPPSSRPPILAWVIVVPHSREISYGPKAFPKGATEPFVMVIDADTGKILANFQEQPER